MQDPWNQNDYGAANSYEFDNPEKWVTKESVPLLDEHEMTNEAGKPVAAVDKSVLEEIAANNNRRVYETGDPATLILGHTSDDPVAPEKPAKGFVVNYRVKPFKRDPKTGQVVYAIHGDFKVRHHNAHILEEYPRRSVELWWNKKELDPIALLGGTSPERDLSLVIRKARLRHLSLLGGTVPDRDMGHTIRFSRRGNQTIESYEIEGPERYAKRRNRPDPWRDSERMRPEEEEGPDFSEHDQAEADEALMHEPPLPPPPRRRLPPRQKDSAGNFRYADEEASTRDKGEGKVGKVMGEFKRGELHSGSKHGPKVTSREQAVAIAMSEAGKSRKSRTGGSEMPKGYPPERARYGHDGMKLNYADSDMDTDDLGDYDPGDEELQPEDAGDGDGVDASTDPVVAKVFQSKQWKDLESKLDRILSAIEQEEEPMGGGGPPGMGGMGGPEEEMPPPAAGGLQAGGMPPPGPEEGGEYPEDEEPDEEDRLDHGERPVKMNMGGYPGPGNTNIPTFGGGGTTGKRYQRSAGGNAVNKDSVIRLQRRVEAQDRELQDLRLKYSMAEAKNIVDGLVQEGVLFGSSPQEEEAAQAETVEYLAHLGLQNKADRDYEVNVIRTRYRRRPSNPAAPAFPGVARYARNGVGTAGNEDPEEYEPRCPQEATDLVDLMTGPRKMSRAKAVETVRKRQYQPFDVTTGN